MFKFDKSLIYYKLPPVLFAALIIYRIDDVKRLAAVVRCQLD